MDKPSCKEPMAGYVILPCNLFFVDNNSKKKDKLTNKDTLSAKCLWTNHLKKKLWPEM